MHVVPAGVRALPCLLLKLACTLRLAELHLEAQVPGLEACGAVVIRAFAVVLGELVRRCCARWQANFVDRCARHRAAGGWRKRSLKQYISSSSLFRHVCSDFPRRTRSSSVKLRSSVGAPCSVLDDDALSESTMSRGAWRGALPADDTCRPGAWRGALPADARRPTPPVVARHGAGRTVPGRRREVPGADRARRRPHQPVGAGGQHTRAHRLL